MMIAFVVICGIISFTKACCGPNEVNVTCPAQYQPTCENPNPIGCVNTTCASYGCVCKQGYIRQNIGGPCIRKSDCKGICGIHEVNVTCPNPCPPTCANPNPGLCPAICKPYGCVCEEGYIRQFPGGPCISKCRCGKVCGPFEVSIPCDQPCQPTCQDPNRPPCDTLICGKPDCICKKGYIRETEGGQCIPRGNCSALCEAMDPNSMFYPLCRPCPISCPGQPILFCPAICQSGCGCKKGFFTNRITGKCVLAKDCPPTT